MPRISPDQVLLERIALVDNTPANLVAACGALKEALPSVILYPFTSAKEVMAQLDGNMPTVDFVITDMDMEDPQAGRRVANAFWSWNIPVTVISGGTKNHGKSQVTVGYPRTHVDGEKDDPEVWKRIYKIIFGGDITTNALLQALKTGKRDQPDLQYGKICGTVTAIDY